MNPELLLSRIRIVLCRTSHPGNIGAAARAMKCMGLNDLRLVAPYQFPDPQATALAAGADDILGAAGIHSTLAEALAGTVHAVALTVRQRDLAAPALRLRDDLPGLLALAAEGCVALVFGNEAAGLNNEEVACCRNTLSIPTNPEFSSLNLGAAVQILCHELRMAAFGGIAPVLAHPATPSTSPPAESRELEALLATWEAAMQHTGFLNPAQPARVMQKMRRLLARARLEKTEASILHGMLASVIKPTGHGPR